MKKLLLAIILLSFLGCSNTLRLQEWKSNELEKDNKELEFVISELKQQHEKQINQAKKMLDLQYRLIHDFTHSVDLELADSIFTKNGANFRLDDGTVVGKK